MMAYGQVNADVIGTSVAGSNLGAGNASLMKSRILNGGMVIDQRNAGASVTIPATTVTYTLDRYLAYASQASKFSVQQLSSSAPTGFTNYLGATSLSAYTVGAAETFVIVQKIEGYNTADLGWGTANAKTVTLSFQAYSSLTGTFGGVVSNSAQNRSYPFSYSIPVANTWTNVSITIAGDTSGTWLTTNGTGIQVIWNLGTGSTLSGTAGAWAGTQYNSATGATSVVGTSGATFYITGVQLEVGSSATGYEYRQYGQELALCQRYCFVLAKNGGYVGYVGQCISSTQAQGAISFPVTMRAVPSLTAISDYTGFSTYNSVGATNAISAFTIASASQTVNNFFYALVSTGLTAGNASILAILPTNVPIIMSAEL